MILKTLLRIVFRFEDEGEKGILNYLCGRSLMLRLFLYWFSFVGRYQMTCWLAEVGYMTHGHAPKEDPNQFIRRMIYWLYSPRLRETEKTRIHMQFVRTSTARTNSTCKTRLVRIKHNSQRNASPVSHGGYIFFFRFDCSTRLFQLFQDDEEDDD